MNLIIIVMILLCLIMLEEVGLFAFQILFLAKQTSF